MKGIILYQATNSGSTIEGAKRRSDATGAFIPEAKAFKKFIEKEYAGEVTMVPVKHHLPKWVRRGKVKKAFREQQGLDFVAFFCHGYPKGLGMGIPIKKIEDVVKAMAPAIKSSCKIILYACNTAKGKNLEDVSGPGADGGFADHLRDSLCEAGKDGVTVVAHRTAGHTTMNPYSLFFKGSRSKSGRRGGLWVVEPKTAQWGAWCKALKGELRFRFPFMAIKEIRESL